MPAAAPSILAFRPPTVVARLKPRNEACPLSLRDVLRPAIAGGLVLPIVRAPIAAVARGALLAAREAGSAVGLALPPGVPPEPWFDAVAEAADATAAGLPLVLSGEVRVAGGDDAHVERAHAEAWRLVEAGLTHVAVDVGAVAAADRARVFGDVARGALERGLGVDCLLPFQGEGSLAARGGALLEALARRGVAVDVVSVRCPAPAGAEAVRDGIRALAALCQAASGLPVLRRGPVTPELLAALPGSPVKGCEDGGAAANAALAALPWDAIEGEGAETRGSPLERAAAGLSGDDADRLEARAYVEAADLLERLHARGSAAVVAGALAAELREP